MIDWPSGKTSVKGGKNHLLLANRLLLVLTIKSRGSGGRVGQCCDDDDDDDGDDDAHVYLSTMHWVCTTQTKPHWSQSLIQCV